MALDRKYQCAIIVLMLLAGILLVVPILQKEAPAVPFSVFASNLVKSDSVAIVMDIRGADADSARKILQCGTDLAGSELFVGKTLSNYACDESGCLTAEIGTTKQRTVPVADLDAELSGKTVFYIQNGKPDNRFTAIRSTITMDSSFSGNCQISVK